jgi:Sec23/Sec24 helical domain
MQWQPSWLTRVSSWCIYNETNWRGSVLIDSNLHDAAVERGLTTKLDDARDAIVNKVVDMLGVYKTHILGSGSGSTPQLTISDNIKLLPALTLGLLKHVSSDAESIHSLRSVSN